MLCSLARQGCAEGAALGVSTGPRTACMGALPREGGARGGAVAAGSVAIRFHHTADAGKVAGQPHVRGGRRYALCAP